LDGVTARIMVEERVAINGPTLFSGYRLRPDLTAASLHDGWLLTADRGRLADGLLVVAGRLDDMLITGGLKVDRAEVEQWVRRWSAARGGDAVVLGIADQEWGTKIIAVSDAGGSLLELQAFVREHLPAYATPRSLVHLDRLPRLASGKPDRRALQAVAEASR
jgi:O-succinylbenzoic acid--CoA ligase